MLHNTRRKKAVLVTESEDKNVTIQPGIDRDTLRHFVTAFYRRVRAHAVLGPIFEEKLAENWDHHIEILSDFWLTVLAGIPAYKGNPFAVHQRLAELKPEHFPLWLQIFSETAHDEFAPDLAALAIEKANRIADSLRQGLFFRAAPKAAG